MCLFRSISTNCRTTLFSFALISQPFDGSSICTRCPCGAIIAARLGDEGCCCWWWWWWWCGVGGTASASSGLALVLRVEEEEEEEEEEEKVDLIFRFGGSSLLCSPSSRGAGCSSPGVGGSSPSSRRLSHGDAPGVAKEREPPPPPPRVMVRGGRGPLTMAMGGRGCLPCRPNCSVIPPGCNCNSLFFVVADDSNEVSSADPCWGRGGQVPSLGGCSWGPG